MPQHRLLSDLLYVITDPLKLLIVGEDACERHEVAFAF
jgi:hypothetical protein